MYDKNPRKHFITIHLLEKFEKKIVACNGGAVTFECKGSIVLSPSHRQNGRITTVPERSADIL